MIRLTCTQCQATLDIDDGFAGGVCRCQHCGTIQTVPSQLRPAQPGSAPTPASKQLEQTKTLYQGSNTTRRNGNAAATDALEQLSDYLTQGAIGSGVTRTRTPSHLQVSPAKSAAKRTAIMASIAVAALLLGIFTTYSLMKSDDTQTPGKTSPPMVNANPHPPLDGAIIPTATPPTPSLPKLTSPGILDVKLTGPLVIYLIDAGPGSRGYFSDAKTLVESSVASLGSSFKYQVLFWQADGDIQAFPNQGPESASPNNAKNLARQLSPVGPGTPSDLAPSFNKALQNHADEIVILTQKTLSMDDVTNLMASRSNAHSNVKVNCILLGQTTSDAFYRLAAQTGGKPSFLPSHLPN